MQSASLASGFDSRNKVNGYLSRTLLPPRALQDNFLFLPTIRTAFEDKRDPFRCLF